ncbi:auxin efflux carrier [Exophiala viscosa]|uniref:auxin efflux carrier n=1 Tax=Exophiala viscosa TaxID=2486360 RepID=UPI00219235A5|nr:auxin efflux carrier [Exophiala viscosa]
MVNGILQSFLGALQASISILLVIFYGVLANQYKLLDGAASKKISKVCVHMFLPALLITKVGSELHADTGTRYVPILIWSLFFILVSVGIGLLAVRVFKLPAYVTPALAFNNTTSLPLLLIESLETSGILDKLLTDGDTVSKAISRAESYFLVCALVSNSLTFALGPRLLAADKEPEQEDQDDEESEAEQNGDANGDAEHGEDNDDEQTSLLPNRVRKNQDKFQARAFHLGKQLWDKIPQRAQGALSFMSDFANPPLIGAVIGAILGLVPPLHRVFFNDTEEGGFFKAWLTQSISKIGQLFVTLQVVVVGVSLSASLQKVKRGEDKTLPWGSTLFILGIRFIIWPVLSIAIIWLLATKTNLLLDDPILWFTMALMPTGPPAMILVAMAEVSGASEDEKMTISKILTVSRIVELLLH